MKYKFTTYLIILIIVTGFLLRFIGTNPGYNPYHADETMSYASALHMLQNRTLDPGRYDYPSLIPIINLFLFLTIFIPIHYIKFAILNQNFSPLWMQVIPNPDLQAMYWSRYVTSFVSSITVLLVFIISVKLYKSKLIGFFSALILALNYKTILNSHFGLPDIYNAFFFCICLYLALIILEKQSFLKYLLAGLFLGFSVSTKLQIFGLLPIALVHLSLAIKKKGDLLAKLKVFFSIKAICFILSAIFIFILINPFHFLNFSKFIEVNQYTLLKYYSQRSFQYGISYLFYIGLTPYIFITAFLGLFLAMKKDLFKSLLLLSIPCAFLYTILVSVGGTAYTRNYVSIIPFFAVFSAFFFNWLFHVLRKFSSSFISILITAVLLSISLKDNLENSLILDRSFSMPWEMVSLNTYISNELNSSSGIFSKSVNMKPKIAAHQWDFSIVLSKPNNVSDRFENIPLSLGSSYTLRELQKEKADFAILGLDIINTENSWWMTKQDLGFDFWNSRKKSLANQFTSLAVNELSQNTIFPAIKPWQAPDNNYLFVRIPPLLKFKSKRIVNYYFDKSGLESWRIADLFDDANSNLVYDSSEGYKKVGALKIQPSTPKFPVIRIMSDPFEVAPGKGYLVEAMVKSIDNLDIKQRDGFLRLDFYEGKNSKLDADMQSLQTNLSARYFGKNWSLLEVSGIAPRKAKFATVSFQISSPGTTTFLFDDVIVNESKNYLSNSSPSYQIKDEILYPYSQGGL